MTRLKTKEMEIAMRARKAADEQAKLQSQTPVQDTLEIDETTGQLMMKADFHLTQQQKLQLRIAKARGIDIDGLKDEQFEVLKTHKKLQDRERMLNNLFDFFE